MFFHQKSIAFGCGISYVFFIYINAVADHAQFYDKPVYIKFLLFDRLCAFYPRQDAFTPVRDIAEAMAFLPQLLDFIVDVSRRSPAIIPNHEKFEPASAIDIYRLLPGSNCRSCGYATCLAFAAALSRQCTSMVECPHLANPMEEKATFPVYDNQGNLIRMVSLDIDTARLRHQIDQKESHIHTLQSRLLDVENSRAANIDSANAKLPTPLTQREIQVLRRMARGATNKKISKELHISEHTVKSHVSGMTPWPLTTPHQNCSARTTRPGGCCAPITRHWWWPVFSTMGRAPLVTQPIAADFLRDRDASAFHICQ